MLTCPVAAAAARLPAIRVGDFKYLFEFSVAPQTVRSTLPGWYIKACHPYTERKSRTPVEIHTGISAGLGGAGWRVSEVLI